MDAEWLMDCGWLSDSGLCCAIVNTGLGTSHIPVRFGVVPELAVFDLYL